MADTPTPSAEAIRLAAVLYWLPYAVPEWSKPDENAGVLAIAHRFDAFAAQARVAAIEDAAKIADRHKIQRHDDDPESSAQHYVASSIATMIRALTPPTGESDT